ncbi:hypothetical protein PILCRDRAFT_88881 [Piloderma croceum F 1598]|uniref:Uncharacterized protein n=1 Tax=Piloderma croceum (strain F 1598) TaxID=765440 RepID=A0A0C3FRE5_PILCF|nr:hypothetical protein PILCRDRAFT_88881 [Piloderma croceum F 1598]
MTPQIPAFKMHSLMLSGESAARDALAKLEACADVEPTINYLLSKPNLLEFVISAKTAHRLDNYWKSVELAPHVLQAISTLMIPDAHEDILAQIGGNQKRKRGKCAAVTVNTEPFRKLGVDIPSTSLATEQLMTSILQDQKCILEYYLSILHHPNLSHIFKDEYIRQNDGIVLSLTPTVQKAPDPDIATKALTNTVPSAYLMVQPMKAALYFDSAVGFGEWRILLSTCATQDLREARRTDAKLFKIIVKKIKFILLLSWELSNGHFSDDNQKRLNGLSVEVPIYEAKMTRDQCLVVERQVLHIFGIYTHAQLDRRLWDSMGTQLARKGKEYRKRCNFQNRPYHAGDKVILPASFPVPEAIDAELESSVLDLPREDLEEVHLPSLLVPQEKQIIKHNTSCYVLGHSGTGKTTTMLFKMLGIERVWATHSNSDIPKPSQLFVTQSQVLAETASHSPRELVKLLKARQAQHEEQGLVDLDDETSW